MILTKHLYISKYPINQSSKSLILGTIHPHNDINNTSNFKIDFFYGNKNSLWTILSEAKNERLDTLDEILISLFEKGLYEKAIISNHPNFKGLIFFIKIYHVICKIFKSFLESFS